MAKKKVPYLIALGMVKDQIKASDLKKLGEFSSETLMGASLLGVLIKE
jgi:hypothetical protein